MCYPPPGPRCSSHANEEWLKAVAAFEEEQDTHKRIRLQVKVDKAFRAFTATPRGQNRLIREMGTISSDPENKEKLVKLSLQLRDGQLTRKNQLAAFHAYKNSKEESIKTLLQTSNKQEQAVGIAFHVLMDFLPENDADIAHIGKNNCIEIGEAKILCLPQKHQRLFGMIKEEADGYLSSSTLSSEILDVLADFADPSLITPNHASILMEQLVSILKSQGILYYASVDVKTENVIFENIDNLLDTYEVSFTQKRKLGGTCSYIHGDTEELRQSLLGSPFDECEITQTVVKGQKRTYLLNTPYAEDKYSRFGKFYLAGKVTPEGTRFHEVRIRHQSSQYEIFATLTRKSLVISSMDELQVKKFILTFSSSEDAL